MNKILILITFVLVNCCFAQREEATITKTFGTNSVYPRQFPSMTIRKMNENEYWIYDSLNTNTIFHRIFPTYIVRKQNTYTSSQKWGVYRTTSTNSVYPRQFPDRYISDLDWRKDSLKEEENEKTYHNRFNQKENQIINPKFNNAQEKVSDGGYTYSKSLRFDKKASYSPEGPE